MIAQRLEKPSVDRLGDGLKGIVIDRVRQKESLVWEERRVKTRGMTDCSPELKLLVGKVGGCLGVGLSLLLRACGRW